MATFDIIMDERKKLVEKLIENMKNDEVIFKKGWDVSLLRPQNPVSEVNYLGINRLKLGLEAIINDYKDPRWVTFTQAKEKGWNIKKGAKGIRCEKWIFSKKVKEKDENGKLIEVEKELYKPFPSYFTVFNAEQVEGIPALKIEKISETKNFEIAELLIQSSECPIKELAQEQAFYIPKEDIIVLPLREAFKSKEAFLRTTIHEMGHSTGHKSRLNRDQTGTFGTPSYAKEELVAELSSIFTQAKLGIKLEGQHFNDHTAYLKSWISVLENDPNELFKAVSKAELASERLYQNYLIKERELSKEKNIIENLDQEIQNGREELKNINMNELGLFKDLTINFNYSEIDLYIPDNTTLKGYEAYKFLDNIMKQDILQNEVQKRIKTKFSLQYKDYDTKEIRVNLGDLEFGGKEKVSEGLEYRLKSFAKFKKVSVEEIKEVATEMAQTINQTMTDFKIAEKEYEKESLKTEFWEIEFNERSNGIKSFSKNELNEANLKEIYDLDKTLASKDSSLKFFFEHWKDGMVIDKVRIDVGSNDLEAFKYLKEEIKDLEKRKENLNILIKNIPEQENIFNKNFKFEEEKNNLLKTEFVNIKNDIFLSENCKFDDPLKVSSSWDKKINNKSNDFER